MGWHKHGLRDTMQETMQIDLLQPHKQPTKRGLSMLSAKQAAKETGKSTSTITRAIKTGKITAQKKSSGGYEITPSELFRVFPPVNKNEVAQPVPQDREMALLKQLIADKDKTIDDLRTRLDQESEERRKLNTMLIDQRKSFWGKIWGK